MPECYTCHQQITFDKNVRSASGKQIPLNPDNSKHSHDENNNSTWKPNPNFTPEQTQQFNQYNQQPNPPQQRFKAVAAKTSQIGAPSSGGSYMDTKRLRVMVEELSKEVREIKDILNSRTILDTNRYEGKNDQIYNVIAPFLSTQGVIASDLYKEQQQQKKDPLSINHGKKADINETVENTLKPKHTNTKVVEDESNDFPVEETLTDEDDDDDEDDKGVIDDL